jgi:hypothetical protein
MGGSSQSNQVSAPVAAYSPNVFGNTGYDASSSLASQTLQTALQPSVYSQPMQQAILNPDFSGSDPMQSALYRGLLDQTSGNSAIRGLGAPTQSAEMQTLANPMLAAGQQNISNLSTGRSQDITQQGATMQALLNLTGLAMPQPIAGSNTVGSSGGKTYV